jgi:SAM-dependent methyltransferase
MFTKTAAFYDAIYGALGKDYVREADALVALARARKPHAATLLDVGCGTGAHLAGFERHGLACRGVEKDLPMLAIARARLPEIEIEPGDMLDFALPERYDVVTCLFGTIAYARTKANMRRAIANLASHLAPEGLLIVEPFIPPERWTPGHLSATFVDRPDFKLARVCLSKQLGSIAILDFHYLVGTLQGVERHFERHEAGLFSEADYREAFGAADLSFESVEEPAIFANRGLYLGARSFT